MRAISETSHETRKLVELFHTMSIGAEITFEQATKIVGFEVKPKSVYYSARRIAIRDHNAVVDTIREAGTKRAIGFRRLNGEEIVKNRGSLHMGAIRRRAKRGAQEMEVAISGNLESSVSCEATDKLTRFRLFSDVAKKPISNKRNVAMPDSATETDVREQLAKYAPNAI